MNFSVLLRTEQRTLQAALEFAPVDQPRKYVVTRLISDLRGRVIDFLLQIFLRGLERLRHAVNTARQCRQLAASAVRHLHRQISLGDLIHRADQAPDRPRNTHAHAQR